MKLEIVRTVDIGKTLQQQLLAWLYREFATYADEYAWAVADWHVLAWEGDLLIGHVDITERIASAGGKELRLGGVGGVVTLKEWRKRGVATAALDKAACFLRDGLAVPFGLLVCDPALTPFYQNLGWRVVAGPLVFDQPASFQPGFDQVISGGPTHKVEMKGAYDPAMPGKGLASRADRPMRAAMVNMETKAENPVTLLKDLKVDPFIRAYFELCQLKQLYRQGWLHRGVSRQRCESVAEHSFACALLVAWLAGAYYPELDICKALQMALVHDFGEVYAGDLIPGDAVEPEEKHRRAAGSVGQVFGKLPGGEAFLSLWEEFERNETPEARFVRQIDRLEMGLQAGVYALQGLVEPDEFFASARLALEDPLLAGLMEALDKLRS